MNVKRIPPIRIPVFAFAWALLFLPPVHGATPEIHSIAPAMGLQALPTEITITGAGFEHAPKAALYGGGPYVKGTYEEIFMPLRHVFVSGKYGYMTLAWPGYSMLEILDLSDPTNPTFVGLWHSPESYPYFDGLFVSGNKAYITGNTFYVVNVADPANPVLIGSCETPDDSSSVHVSGDYAYVACDLSGLQVIDVSVPWAPTIVGSCYTSSYAKDIHVSGSYAYIANGSSGFCVIDIADPTDPLFVGECDTFGQSEGVHTSGDYAYVANYYGSLQIIDIHDPSNPYIVGTCETASEAYAVKIMDRHALVVDRTTGLVIVDVSDPKNPSIVDRFFAAYDASDIFVSGNYGYMTDDMTLTIIDVASPISPSTLGSKATPGYANKLRVSGDLSYVADGESGLQIIDVSDPSRPRITASVDTPDSAKDVFITDGHAYVADDLAGLQIIDISGPMAPTVVGACDTPGNALGVRVSGAYAYVADYDSGLQVIDVSDPAAPVIVGSCDTPDWAWSLDVSGNYVYVADYDSGLQVIDISDPEYPAIVFSVPVSTAAWSVHVSGGYAYVGGNHEFAVLDIAEPASPTVVGSCDVRYIWDLSVSGSHVYCAAAGISVVDVSDPAHPVYIGACQMPAKTEGVAVSGNRVYVADGSSGLQVARTIEPCTDVRRISSSTLEATVPAGLPVGSYDLHVANRGGETAKLDHCFDMVPTWSAAYEVLFASASDLSLFRRYRDKVLKKTSPGGLYTKILYRYSAEALDVLLKNDDLMSRAKHIIAANRGAVVNVLSGREGVIGHTDDIISFLDAFAAKSPPALRQLAKMVKKQMEKKLRLGERFLRFKLR